VRKELISNKMAERSIRLLLLAGIVYFGFIFPDSLSDHTKMVHFCAHMGMSFFVASCVYVICNIMLQMKRLASLLMLTVITLVVGGIYKYFEISGEGLLHAFSFGELLKVTGCYTSMSQNTAGILAAILLIEYLVQYFRSFSPARR
jgi:hypothetical protein